MNDASSFERFARSLPGAEQLEQFGQRLGIVAPPPEVLESGIPPEPIRPVYSMVRHTVAAYLGLSQDLTVEGLENIPETGPAILAPNHLNVHDSTVLLAVVPRVLRFVGKAEYLDQAPTRMFLLLLGNIPVKRSDASSGRAALDAAAHVLRAGDLFGIFPEGTRSRDGLLHRGKTGVARLSIETGVPVIPVGLIGTDDLQAYDDPVFTIRRGAKVTVRFGEPMPPKRYADRRGQALAPRQMTDDIMFEISQLSGQRYIDEYMQRLDEV